MNDFAVAALIEIERRIHSTTEDGLLYEDAYVRVERKDGKVFMSGKPIKCPFFYQEKQ